MTAVTLEGLLGEKLGKTWKLEVDSIFEIFEAIEANSNRISKYFRDLTKTFTHFMVFIDGQAMPAHLLKSKILKEGSEVKIVPIVQGGWLIVVGLLLIVLSVVLSIVLSPKAPKDIKTDSTILGGIRNVMNKNIVVPLGYGRLRVGSIVIGNDVSVKQIKTIINTPIGGVGDGVWGTKQA